MRKIWKYGFDLTKERFSIEMPGGATILTAQIQHGKPVMWVLFLDDEGVGLAKRNFVLFETGAVQYMGDLRFIATLQFFGGESVLHLFEEER